MLLRPVDPPEVWCSGVTYERSRDARIEESGSDVYALVYDADRPELFLKDAQCRRTVGPNEPIAIRSDATWNVPEPEIGVVLGDDLTIVGYTIGNDVSSRDIEGANPLYLPQAKVFAGACAIGPAVYVPEDWEAPLAIEMTIRDAQGATLFEGATSTARMKRSFPDLVSWLVRDNPVPPGSVLLTGTGLVPPDDFTLLPGHVVEIHVPEIGTLTNPVVRAADLLERTPDDRDPVRHGGTQLHRRRVERERLGRDLREAKPVAALRGDRRLRRLGRRRRQGRGRGGADGVRRLGSPAGARTRGVLLQGGRRDRGARRADRAGHDRRDGQAAARGPDGGGARRAILRYSAGEAYRPAGEVYEPSVGNQTLYTRRRPLGVVALITRGTSRSRFPSGSSRRR